MPKAKPSAAINSPAFLEVAKQLNSLLTDPAVPDYLADILIHHVQHLCCIGSGRENDFTDEALAKGMKKMRDERLSLGLEEAADQARRRVRAWAIWHIHYPLPDEDFEDVLAEFVLKGVNEMYMYLSEQEQETLAKIEERTRECSIEYNEFLLQACEAELRRENAES